MKSRFAVLIPLCALALAAAARAEVKEAAPDSFLIVDVAPLKATPAKAYAAIVQVQQWWSDEYTWSGKAANLSFTAETGACLCERWPGGSVEVGRVIATLPERLVRLETTPGPLQELAVKGVLGFYITQDDDGATQLELDYRVNGPASGKLDQLAPQVDEMMSALFARLTRYIETGNPEEKTGVDVVPDEQAKAAADAAVRASILEQWRQQAMGQQAGGTIKAAPAAGGTTPPAVDKAAQPAAKQSPASARKAAKSAAKKPSAKQADAPPGSP